MGTPNALGAERDAARQSTRTRRAGARRRRRHRAEAGTQPGSEGFAILEVVIAFTMLVIVLVPSAALFSTVIGITANARDRVSAGNLAAQAIENGRAASFSTLSAQVGTTQTSTQKVSGITYTVAQTSAWVNESNAANACGGTGNGAAGTQPILALTDTVTWPDMGSTLPVVAQTDIAPPAGYYSSALGNLAVSVVDSNNQPVVGATVTMTSPAAPSPIVLPTGATGCAFAAFLNAGVYSITASMAGYVDMDENSTATKTAVAVGAGATVGETLNYAPAAVVPISYTSTAAIMPTTTTTVATTTTTVAPTTTTTVAGTTTTSSTSTTTTTVPTTTTTTGGTTTTTVPGTVTYPTNGYPVTIYNATPGSITYPAPLAGALQLWAYSNGYDIYPGGCADNDPDYIVSSSRVYSVPYTPFSVTQGATTPDTLQLYGLSITATDGPHPVSNVSVQVTDISAGCTSNNVFNFAAVAGNSTVIGLPLGTFKIKVSGTAIGGPVTGTIASLSVNGTTPVAAQTVAVS